MKRIFIQFLLLTFLYNFSFGQWTSQGVGLLSGKYVIISISAVNENVVWAVSYDSSAGSIIPQDHLVKVLKSVNGGEHWEVYDVVEAPGRISFDIEAFDENTAWITTQDYGFSNGTGLLITTDGGETWTEKYNNVAAGVWVRFFDQMNGVCISRENIAITDDGGNSWKGIPVDSIPPFLVDEATIIFSGTNSCVSVGDRIWFGSSYGNIYRSFDKGQTWTTSEFPDEYSCIHSIAFKDSLNGLAISTISSSFANLPNTRIAKTSDGGISWTSLPPTIYKFRNIAFVPGTENTYMAAGFMPGITAYSTDGGENWILINDTYSYDPIQFVTPSVGWVGRISVFSDGQPVIYKWEGEPFAVENSEISNTTSIEIYPNPFSDILSIETKFKGKYNFEIADLNGTVKSRIFSNSHNLISRNLGYLPPGIYFVKIWNNEQRTVRKIVKQ